MYLGGQIYPGCIYWQCLYYGAMQQLRKYGTEAMGQLLEQIAAADTALCPPEILYLPRISFRMRAHESLTCNKWSDTQCEEFPQNS